MARHLSDGGKIFLYIQPNIDGPPVAGRF